MIRKEKKKRLLAAAVVILALGLIMSKPIIKSISKGIGFIYRIKALEEELYPRVGRLETRVNSYHPKENRGLTRHHPELNDYYYQSFDNGTGKWGAYFPSTHFDKGGYRNGFMRYRIPSERINSLDPSMVGIGEHPNLGRCLIANYLYTTPPGFGKISAFLEEGAPDFRGAKVSVCIRGNNFIPNGAEFFWLSEAQSNIEVLDNKGWRRTAWIYTDFPLTKYLLDGKWHKVEFQLVNDPCKWMYVGHWPYQDRIGKYAYWPLEDVLSHHNISFDFILAYVDKNNLPTGSIDFDEFEISYHNPYK